MGITVEPTTRQDRIIPAFKIQEAGSLQEEKDISFSEGCCTSCVGIIDMVNSTKITARLGRAQMTKYYCFFINWAGAMVRGYGGKVVKNTGDGLLFYFPTTNESENIKAIRDCLDCGVAMTRLHANVNMKLYSELLPELNYRVSLDYGEVSVARTIDSGSLDIFSTTVNICAKINSIAAPNTVVIGGDMYEVSKNLGSYSFQQVKKTISIADRPYPVYSVSEPKNILHYLRTMRREHRQSSTEAPDVRIDEVKTT